jgi:hypothetical protein
METPNDTERNRHYVTVNVDSERKDPPTQPGGVFLCPKETAPARGRAEGRLTSGYAEAAQHGSDCELKFCFRAGYFGVPSARGAHVHPDDER